MPRQTLENHKKRIVSRRRFQTLRLIGEQVAESLSGNFLRNSRYLKSIAFFDLFGFK